jgi:phosphatidylglycerol:prolipoprotein diacylglycerol transferase
MNEAMPIVHHPWNFRIGPLPLTGFGVAVLLAFVVAQIISQRMLEQRGHTREAAAIPDLIVASVLGMLIGGKLYYAGIVTGDWSDLFSRAGFVFWGGLIGGVVLNWLYITRKKLPFHRISDVGGVAIAAGYAVGRTGCWAVGDDYGRPWSGPLAVVFPEGSPPSTARNLQQMFGVPVDPGVAPETVLAVHPTQLYETALGFVMFAILWRFRNHRHAEGWLFGLYGVVAGIERFVVEFFRAKDDRIAGPFTLAQILALAIAVAGAWWMSARSRPSAAVPAPA